MMQNNKIEWKRKAIQDWEIKFKKYQRDFETDFIFQAEKGMKIYKAELFIQFQEFYGVK